MLTLFFAAKVDVAISPQTSIAFNARVEFCLVPNDSLADVSQGFLVMMKLRLATGVRK
jgi:hypothetical protein